MPIRVNPPSSCVSTPISTASAATVPIMKISECAKLINRNTPYTIV
jgi:hypothetical protein